MGQQAGVREAVGVFIEVSQIKAAGEDLLAAGFDRQALGLLTSRDAAQRSLGATTDGGSERPSAEEHLREVVRHESVGDVVHGWVGGLSLAGTTALGAAAVASAAVLGGALVAAAAGAAAVGAVGAAMSAIIHESDAEYLEEQIDDGRLLLFVRTADADQERLALQTLSKHGAIETKMVTVH